MQAPLLNATPLPIERPIETPPRPCCPPKYSCCCAVGSILLSLLAGAAAGGGLVATVLLQLAAKPNASNLPPASSCCAEATEAGLTGRFAGNVSATKTVLWHTLHVDFQMVHTFRAHNHSGGLADVEVVPYRSPANALAGFRCTNVSFAVRNCSVDLRSPCLAAALAKDSVTELRLTWDGGDALQVYEGFTIVGYPQIFQWVEQRE